MTLHTPSCLSQCDHEPLIPGPALRGKIEIEQVAILNAQDESAKEDVIMKPVNDEVQWEERKTIVSEEGQDLIINIPFNGQVKIFSIIIMGGTHGTTPKQMKAFVNTEGIDFENVEGMKHTQEWDLVDMTQMIEYKTQVPKFAAVQLLTLYFPDNFTSDLSTQIKYISMQGEWERLNKEPIKVTYEAAANPADHKVKGKSMFQAGSQMGM